MFINILSFLVDVALEQCLHASKFVCFISSFFQVTDRLQKNEYTQEFNIEGSMKSFDSNQLSSNSPIEDTRCEARCLLTAGKLLISHVTMLWLKLTFGFVYF